MSAVGQYLFNWVYLADISLNVLIGGDPRQTLSARMGRDVQAGRCVTCRYICRFLDMFEADHCAKAWAAQQKPLDPTYQTTGV